MYRINFNKHFKKGQFIFGPYDEEDATEYVKLKSPYFFKPYVAVGWYISMHYCKPDDSITGLGVHVL